MTAWLGRVTVSTPSGQVTLNTSQRRGQISLNVETRDRASRDLARLMRLLTLLGKNVRAARRRARPRSGYHHRVWLSHEPPNPSRLPRVSARRAGPRRRRHLR